MKSFFKRKQKEKKQGSSSSIHQEDVLNFNDLSDDVIYHIAKFLPDREKFSLTTTSQRNYLNLLSSFHVNTITCRVLQLREALAEPAIANTMPLVYKKQLELLKNKLLTLTLNEREDYLEKLNNLSEKIMWKIIQQRQKRYAYNSNAHFITVQASKLTRIPQVLPDKINPRKITEINFAENNLEEVPVALASFFELRRLNLSKNKITFIPMAVINMPYLENLNLNDNHLAQLPAIGKRVDEEKFITIQRNRFSKKELKKIKPFIKDDYKETCRSQEKAKL